MLSKSVQGLDDWGLGFYADHPASSENDLPRELLLCPIHRQGVRRLPQEEFNSRALCQRCNPRVRKLPPLTRPPQSLTSHKAGDGPWEGCCKKPHLPAEKQPKALGRWPLPPFHLPKLFKGFLLVESNVFSYPSCKVTWGMRVLACQVQEYKTTTLKEAEMELSADPPCPRLGGPGLFVHL